MTAAPLRLFLVDDHTAFRKPLVTVLEREPDLTVVAQAGKLAEARALLPDLAGTLDVALIDLQLPDGDGTDLIRALVQSDPQLRPIVLTADTDPLHHAAAIEAGATGIIGKDAEPADIIRADCSVSYRGQTLVAEVLPSPCAKPLAVMMIGPA